MQLGFNETPDVFHVQGVADIRVHARNLETLLLEERQTYPCSG